MKTLKELTKDLDETTKQYTHPFLTRRTKVIICNPPDGSMDGYYEAYELMYNDGVEEKVIVLCYLNGKFYGSLTNLIRECIPLAIVIRLS